ncbi:lipase/acyltransferase domain-containing protein [Mastigocoleus testarum]|uniref:Lecithin--cholesterol acyltransferase n=1 Tax=Mastigocoleus testarum BC008 TaxID=371196 RepID=A0A0V7ZT82_9CYAN|nr:hypothetical protein [Mastigocoleus testarum]KST67840.1 hypothetical protein BC008_31100 [Mastigocoleus testarum BC008]
MAKTQMKDMIVLVPGTMGSILQKDGQDIWNVSLQAVLRAVKGLAEQGSFFEQIAIEEDDPERDYLDDGIKATGLIQDVRLAPGFMKIIDGYSFLHQKLTEDFNVTCGKNYFEFAYDWRRDNRVSARLLKKLIDDKLPKWQEISPSKKHAKVILIAHSMGGLVCRYYLEHLGGGEYCKALFSLGTSYRGSVKMLDFLANDYRKIPIPGLKDVLATFTSTYQLLPMYPVVKVNEKWQRVGETNGIPGVERGRAKEARGFLEKVNSKSPNNYSYEFKPIIGVGQKSTLQSTELRNGRLKVSNNPPLNPRTQEPLDADRVTGDDTVPVVSAIPIDLSDKLQGLYCGESHCALQSNTQVWNLLKYFLSQLQGTLRDFQNPQITQTIIKQPAISLTVDDLYLRDEEVTLGAEIVNVDSDTLKRKGNFGGLSAIITPASDNGTNLKLEENFELQGNSSYKLSLRKKLTPGLYHLEVETNKADESAPEAVHNLFQVMK